MYLRSGWDMGCSESVIGAVQRRMCPSMCPSVRRALYTALYSSSESTDDVCYVYGMFVMLLACISVLVEAWVVQDRVYSYQLAGIEPARRHR